jgi:hypothetical protein
MINLQNNSSSLSISSHGSREYELDYRARRSSSDKNSSLLSDKPKKQKNKKDSSSSSDRGKNALDHVEEENDNYQVLTNFLKRQDQFLPEEPSTTNELDVYTLELSTIALAVISWVLIAISISLSKYVYHHQKLSVWEDIYGRTLIGSILSYVLMMIKGTSPFDLAPNIRTKLFLMQTCFIIAFGLIMLAIQELSILVVACALLTYFSFSEKFIGINMFFVGWALTGTIILANPFDILNDHIENTFPIIGLIFGILMLAIGRYFASYIKQLVPLSTGKFLFNFATLLIVPSFMIIAFSIESSHVDYGVFEISYFLVNGVVTWTALYVIILVFQQDRKNYLEFLGYTLIIYVWIYHFTFERKDYAVNSASQTTDGQSENASADSVGQTVHTWDYIGLAILIGLRFFYAIYKFFVQYRTSKKKEGLNDSFSLINIS